MVRSAVSLVLVSMLSGCSSVSEDRDGPGSSVDCSAATGSAVKECEIVALVNQRRAEGATCTGKAMAPVAPLKTNSILMGTARAHAVDMATKNYFDHDNQAGQDPFDRMSAAGYQFSAAGENIAAGNADAEGAMQQWMTSTSGHCENIMGGQFEHIGVGYAFSESHQYKHVWVQNFGAP